MYERFTDRARKVMQLANQEAQRLGHAYIGTEHILLGLVKEGSGVAANVLKNLDIDLRKIRLEVEKLVQSGPGMVTLGRLPRTPRAEKVIECAIDEAKSLRHTYVGSEHLLLGLLREDEGVACQVLTNLGLALESVREEVMNLVSPGSEEPRQPVVIETAGPPARDLPGEVAREVAELDALIGRLNEEKQDAVAEQDFTRAAALRDRADVLKKRKTGLLGSWRSPREVNPAWLSWNHGVVPRLARAIREGRKWEDLPVLADTLEEAGCTDWEILAHCRDTLRHGTDCWVIDLLLRDG